MITINSPIVGPPTGTLHEAIDALGSENAEYLTEVFRLAPLLGIDPAIIVAQAAHETDNFTSFWWRSRRNPAGIGITGDPDQNDASQIWPSQAAAARGHLAHMFAYVSQPRGVWPAGLPSPKYWDHRWAAVKDAGYDHSVRTLNDLTGKWAIDPRYALKIAAKHVTLFRQTEPKEMPMKIVATPCPIEIKIIPATNRNRPGLAMPDPSYVTVHEVGNKSPGADEDMHEQFVRNGGGEHSVSFQGVCGPTKFIQLMPMNEAAWHASDGYYGRGNRDSFAIETIQIGDFNKTLNHLAWIVAEMFRNPRRFMFNTAIDMIDDLDSRLVKERTKQHNFWAPDKKNCPQFIRDRGLWPAFLDAVEKELNGRKSAFVAPVVPSWWSEQALLDLMPHVSNGRTYTPLGTRLTALKTVVCYANGLDLGAGKTRANLVAGDVADVRYTYEDDAGREWGITRYGTHVRLTSFDPRIIVRRRELQAA